MNNNINPKFGISNDALSFAATSYFTKIALSLKLSH